MIDDDDGIIRHIKPIIAEYVDDEARTRTENISVVVLQMQSISNKIGVVQMDTLLKDIFENVIVERSM